VLRLGKTLLVSALAIAAVAAIASGRLGWRNYWGGVVYAPFAALIAALLVLVEFRRWRRPPGRRHRRRGA
jgi:uncharacterized membrane protein